MSKHFLYLTNDRLIALIWDRGRISARMLFSANDADTLAAERYFAAQRHLPAYLVTDLIEEDFRLDTIPHLRGSDQEAVLARKLAKIYRTSHFRHAIVQGREEGGRRDDKALFHAIANPDLVQGWLDVLGKTETPLEGIYSSAVLSGLLLKELGIFFPHTLLVTIVPDFNLRQTYFQNKQVKFSRLTSIPYDESRPAGALIAAEISRTWQYLDSLRFFAAEESLEVCLLLHERDRPMMEEAIRAFPLLTFRFLDMGEVAAKINLKSMPASSQAEEILVHQFARGALTNHFADAMQTRFAAFRRAKMALYALTAGILIAGVVGTTYNLHQAARFSNEITDRTQVVRDMQMVYQRIANLLRGQKTPSEVIRDTGVFFNAHIGAEPGSPGPLLRELSTALAEFTHVRLLQVVWITSGDASALPNLQPLPPQAGDEIRSDSRAVPPGATAAGAATVQVVQEADPPLPGNKFHIVQFEAAIRPFSGDFRAALNEVSRLQSRLNEIEGVSAQITSPPLDTGPKAAIKGTLKTIDAVIEPDAAVREVRFIVKVVKTVKAVRAVAP
ncbi:MAG: hypothetical protein JNM52_09060 [Betaproteobacteria bacterium]|nr:hypothetical protein [Betaproteobacteria bacterium]